MASLAWFRAGSEQRRRLHIGALDSVLVGLLTFAALAIVSHLTPSIQFNYVLQADAWRHGHADIDRVGPWIDAIPWRGGWYNVEAPFPAILMLPLVALFGAHANQTLLSVTLGAAAVGAAWQLCKQLGTSVATRVALVAFLTFGTSLFWCAANGDVWLLAHVSACCFSLFALVEVTGKRRGWLVALFAAAAALSRYPLLPTLLVYPFLLNGPDRKKAIFSYVTTLVPIFAVWVWYNEIRWGTPIDSGFALFHKLYYLRANPWDTRAMLDVRNVHEQLRRFFVRPPIWLGHWPWVAVDRFGLALTYTSPALICAFLARRPVGFVIAGWALALITAAPSMLYIDGGGIQFGMRHALDFEPYLFLLMILALRPRAPRWAFVLIGWSVLVGVWGVWFWQTYPPGHDP
jgi:hypothetical protein